VVTVTVSVIVELIVSAGSVTVSVFVTVVDWVTVCVCVFVTVDAGWVTFCVSVTVFVRVWTAVSVRVVGTRRVVATVRVLPLTVITRLFTTGTRVVTTLRTVRVEAVPASLVPALSTSAASA
jgi:hypothetical protein